MMTRWFMVALLAGLSGCALYVPSRPTSRAVVVASGPQLVIIAGTDLRYCDGCDEDVFFYSDFWWVYRSEGWYRRSTWGAPWIVVEQGVLPAEFIRVPPARFKHRYGPDHPAHAHHPDLDTWRRADPPAGPADQGRPADPPRDQHRGGDNVTEPDHGRDTGDAGAVAPDQGRGRDKGRIIEEDPEDAKANHKEKNTNGKKEKKDKKQKKQKDREATKDRDRDHGQQ